MRIHCMIYFMIYFMIYISWFCNEQGVIVSGTLLTTPPGKLPDKGFTYNIKHTLAGNEIMITQM